MKHRSPFLILLSVGIIFLLQGCSSNTGKIIEREVWDKAKAKEWYAQQGWLVGPNYITSTAINQLEMWQAVTFDTLIIDRELALAESLGMNTARVYLHDLLYEQDSLGFFDRIDTFLSIAKRHHIKPMFVIFDSCWDPFPQSGIQRQPQPYVHNSGWVQSPGQSALKDSTQYPRLERYVKGLVARFANDDRILAWDVWNEPDNMNPSSYGKVEDPNKVDLVYPLLLKTFGWARAMNPSQPLTSGIWNGGDWSSDEALTPLQKVQLEQSDILTFHSYDAAALLEDRIQQLQKYDRPIICTEYMARPNGSTFQSSLPIAKKYNVGMINWGFVEGKTQTIYPWDSWKQQYTTEPPLWFHDIFRKDGTPYLREETDLIKSFTFGN